MKLRAYIQNILRLIILTILQVLVFKSIQINWGILQNAHFLIYPLFIILAPMNTPRALLIVISFLMGLTIDSFYDSVGVHAGASVFTAYIRTWILKILEPYEGYSVGVSPSRHNMGLTWFLTYAGILVFFHCLFYFSVEAFSFVYYLDIILKTLFSFIFSFMLILLHQFIFRTKV